MKRVASAASLFALTLLLNGALAGCSDRRDTAGPAVYATGNEHATLSPGAQAVRIGEGGSSFPACAATGVVVNVSPAGMPYLPLRAAPFDEASEVARLTDGARVFLCARSLDQRWQGVVVPPADAPDSDCGVTAPIDAARDYAGPCRSGWTLGTFVRPTAR